MNPTKSWISNLPSTDRLQTLADLNNDALDGQRVLIAADIDVARRRTSNEFHFKISRLAETVRYLLDRNAAVLVLGAQGSTSVRVLEPENTQDLEWHRRALARSLPSDRAVNRLDRIDDLLSAYPIPGTVTLLPNLTELSQEDAVVVSPTRADSPEDSNELIRTACENAPLPKLLREHFEVFVLDDFRSIVRALPSNLGLAAGKPCVVGRGLQGDLESLERLIARTRVLRNDQHRSRICFVGSSRPQDAAIASSLLDADLFDRVVLGPMPSLMVYQEMGYTLGAGPSADIASLIQTHHSLSVVIPTAVRRFASEDLDRLVLPTDFMVANRTGRGRARRVTPEGLGKLADDDRIMSIGPETLKTFAEETRRAGLIFHFGMMSSGQRPYVDYTEAVIRTNLESAAEVYMAGDHILEIAHDVGLVSTLHGQSTGAMTASSLLAGALVPGLAPFGKSDSAVRRQDGTTTTST